MVADDFRVTSASVRIGRVSGPSSCCMVDPCEQWALRLSPASLPSLLTVLNARFNLTDRRIVPFVPLDSAVHDI